MRSTKSTRLIQLTLFTFLCLLGRSKSKAPTSLLHETFSISKKYIPGVQPILPVSRMTGTSVNIDRNVGPLTNIRGTSVVKNIGTINTSKAPGVRAEVFKTSRQGMKFDLKFNLPAGSYDVELGFVQSSNCGAGARVFNVLINGNSRLEAMDVFKEAGGCRKAIVEKFFEQTVDAMKPKPMIIQLQAVAGEAMLSYVRIKSSSNQCVPVTNEARLLSDHLAHSVPGTYPRGGASSYVDRAGRGFVWVQIDGSTSHTHFSYSGKSGKIITYRWTIAETGKFLSNRVKFSRSFPLGTTRLKLTVVDNGCSKHEAETSVTVTGNNQPGAYCYYYKSLPALPGPNTLKRFPRPSFASVQKSLNFGFPFFPFRSGKFIARCIFTVEFTRASQSTEISLTTGGSGTARVYEGEDLILDSKTSLKSAPIVTAVGLSSFELIYKHTDVSKTPRLSFKVNNNVPTKVFHDQSMVMPILTGISPSSGRLEGGAKTKLSGFGLYLPLKVRFGSKAIQVSRNGATAKEVFVNAPPATTPGSVKITAVSSIGIASNLLKYSYSNDCDDVRFVNKDVKTSSGGNLALTQPTSISVWQDGKLYIGTRVGIVQVVDYNAKSLISKSLCYSHKLRDSRYKLADGKLSNRVILGITFDPRDKTPRPYVSVSTLFWEKRQEISLANKLAWSNGAVERLKPATAATKARDPKQCLEYDRNIVRNLPVANGDHSLNELVFTQGGDLLIGVGGYTNKGLPYGNLGGRWGTYFSGAVVLAKLSKGAAFNGVIPYTTPTNHRTAVPKNGYNDVRLYATGVRNLFSMSMARSGKIYALDMGPNCKFGNASSSCSEYKESEALLIKPRKFVPFPGRAIVGPPGDCRYGDKRDDKLLEIKEGKYYGHANLPRAAMTQKSGECRWIDPKTGRVPPPFNAAPPSNYQAPLAMVKSPKTGVREYGGRHFCGKLRNDLIISQMNNRGVWRARLFPNGGLNGNPFMLQTNGGIRVEENAHGDLLFPKYYDNPTQGLFVMRPKVSAKTGLFAANAIPFRHGRAGGTRLIIGGWGFANGVAVKVGAKTCAIVRVSATEIVCKVPKYSGGSNSVSVTVSLNGAQTVMTKAVLYMSV